MPLGPSNFKWSLKDIDELQKLLAKHWDARSIAEAFMTTEDEILAVCKRNDFRMPKASTNSPRHGD